MADARPPQLPSQAADARVPGDLPTLAKLAAIWFQLGLLVVAVYTFGIHNRAFLNLCILTFFAFPVNAVLPLRHRLAFFLAYSLAAIVLVLGIGNGAAVIALGVLLIGLCHLPIPLAARAALVAACGLLFAAMHARWIPSPVSPAIWPILASMFMFRVILYLYDRQHEKGPASLPRTLSYFFMAPNVCFPLFPVIDYKRFGRTYYNEDPVRIHQRGIRWIYRGIVHLLGYRVVYAYFTVDPMQVDGPGALVQFSLSTFLLYLRVSGQFHLIVGMLLLFGFNLPETHHLYYLASSFTDFWRRINIYWKDFMMKVFYYPVHFRLRRFGETKALVLATLVVFAATWILHAYQWFWLRGTLLLEWHDGLFWTVLAALVIAHSLYESRYGRLRSLGGRTATWPELGAQALGTLGTFATICLLWGMWSSTSLSEWLSMWQAAGASWLWLPGGLAALVAASLLLDRMAMRRARTAAPARRVAAAPSFWREAAVPACGVMALLALGSEPVYSRLPAQTAEAIHSLRYVTLNERDLRELERGYYEALIENRNNAELWQAYNGRPPDWNEKRHVRETGDFLEWDLRPDVEMPFKGVMVKTNRWGLRDDDYERAKPPGAVRIAMLGASHVFGEGVANHETFEAVLEERLNREPCDGAPLRFEILNFAESGRSAPQYVLVLENKILAFQPDTLFYVSHRGDEGRMDRALVKAVQGQFDIPAHLRGIVAQAGVTAAMNDYTIRRRLQPFQPAILSESYRRIVEVSRENGIQPVWFLLPMTYERIEPDDVARDMAPAAAAGFEMESLLDVYDGHDPQSLAVASWDDHPNARAHRLIADRLYQRICSEERWLARWRETGGGVRSARRESPATTPGE